MSNSRILVVDDEPIVAQLLTEGLIRSNKGYTVETAATGEEALKKISELDYILVITDYKMPRMNGLELAQLIRTKSPKTRIVMMTAYGSEQIQDTSAKLRVDAFLKKPVDIRVIREIVLQTIANSQKFADAVWQEKHFPDNSIKGHLSTLQSNTNARYVLLLNTSGDLFESAGSTDNLDLINTSVLISANFVAAVEMFNSITRKPGSISCHFQGSSFDLMCQNIDDDYFLAIVYSATQKDGTIRHYTQSTIESIRPLLDNFDLN